MPAPVKLKKEDRFLGTLVALTLAEASGQPTVPKEVQLLKTGTYFDPRYGRFEITKEMLLSMKKNFDDKIMDIEPAFDYKHDSENIAAGWPKSLDIRNGGNELWANVEWTPAGEKKLADKEFRYTSADFTLNFIHNETLKEFGPTLRGAALTNRPVIKGMTPVTLTEGEGNMDEKDKLIAQLQAKIAEMEGKNAGGSGDEKDKEMSAMKKTLADVQKENDDNKKKLSEYAEKSKKDEADKQLAEKKAKFQKMLTEGKAVKAQEEAFIKGDTDKFFELAEKLHFDPTGRLVDPSESGGGQKKKDPQDQVIELAEKKVADKKAADITQGISMVLAENPELAKQASQR